MLNLLAAKPSAFNHLIQNILLSKTPGTCEIVTNNWDEGYKDYPDVAKRIAKDFRETGILTIANDFNSLIDPTKSEFFLFDLEPERNYLAAIKGFRNSYAYGDETIEFSLNSLLDQVEHFDDVVKGIKTFLQNTNISESDFCLSFRNSKDNSLHILNVHPPKTLSKIPFYMTESQNEVLAFSTHYHHTYRLAMSNKKAIKTVVPNSLFSFESRKGTYSMI